MTEQEVTQQTNEDELSHDEIIQLAQAMKDNVPSQDEKQNVHTFLNNVVLAEDTRKIGNLKDDKEYDELGLAEHTVRGSFELVRISDMIINNKYLANYFKNEAEDTLATSLSRNGFLVRQATTTTKQVADATKKIKKNNGWFKKTEEVSGGDITSN